MIEISFFPALYLQVWDHFENALLIKKANYCIINQILSILTSLFSLLLCTWSFFTGILLLLGWFFS